MDRRWGTESAASDDFLQRRGNDGGDQEGEEEEDVRARVEADRFRFLQNGDSCSYLGHFALILGWGIF